MRNSFLGLLVVTFNSLYCNVATASNDDVFCGKLHVSLTVSTLLKDRKSRYLEVSWINAEPQPGDWVGLLSYEPTTSPLRGALYRIHVNKESDWVRTSITQDDVTSYATLDFTPTCLAWVAYVRADNTTVVQWNCLRTEPTWMADMKDLLRSKKLTELFIPGTHDTGAYRKDNKLETIVSKYSFTQEEDVLSQLIYGIRFLDIRVGYYPSRDEKWWVNHGVARIHPLHDILEEVKTFLQHTKEIVILDIHEFPKGFGRGSNVHKLLENYLISELGSLTATSSLKWETTLGDLWSSGNRLVVSYNHDDTVKTSDFLWPSVLHQWGNEDTLRGLYTYLRKSRNNIPRSRPWAAMAELTPSTWQVVLDQLGGLRKMADSVNRNVTEWYRGDWGKNVNVVAVDFFRSTTIVESAILWNIRKGSGNMTCPEKT